MRSAPLAGPPHKAHIRALSSPPAGRAWRDEKIMPSLGNICLDPSGAAAYGASGRTSTDDPSPSDSHSPTPERRDDEHVHQWARGLKSLLLGYYDRAGKLVFAGRPERGSA